MTTKAHNPYELDTEVDLGVDTQADTALPDEIGLSLQDSMTEKSSLPFVLQFPQSQDVRKKINTTKSSDNSTCHWTGEVINEQDQERFYASFSKNGEEYTLDESVLVTSPNKKLPTIGQIHCLWEDKKTGKRIVELKVYYRPEETKEGRKPFQAPKELLDSNYFAQFTIDQVTKKCSVESYEKFRRRRDFPDDVYYFQDFYDYREQQTVEETPADNFSFRRRIVNIALNSKSPVKAKEQLKTSTKAPVNNTTKTSNTTKTTTTIEKPSRRESQQSTQRQNSKGSEPEVDEDATIKLTMPPVEDDEFDFGVIEELAGITNNSIAKHSTNIQEASTLITTQRDVERKKSPSMSDDETTSGGSDKRSKVSPKKTPKASESSSSNSRTTLSVQPSTTRASRSTKKGNSSPLLMTDDSEDVIMKELEIEEEEETQAKPRSRITRQASTMDQSVSSNSKSNSKLTKAQTPKKRQAKDDSDEEFADPEEEKPKPKTRGRPKKQPVKKQDSEDDESAHEEPVSEEEEKPKPKKTRAQAKKAEPKKKKPQPKVDSVEPSDEEETAILEALERETEELDTKTNSAKKRKLRAYTDNDDEDQSDEEKSGPSSPTKVPQTRARGKSTKSAETPRKGSTKSAFEFEGSEEKSEEEESPRKKRPNRRLSVNSTDSKARDKKPVKVEVEEDLENEDSISDSEEKKKWTSPRKNKGPASKREKIKEMLQNYPKLSEIENNDPFDDYDKANDVFEAATEPIVVDVEKFNGRTMKQALATEDNDFELDNFLKDTPKTKRQKQLTPLVTKNDFGSRLGSLSNRMKYYQNWDIAETKEVIEVDDDSQDNRKNSNNSIGSYSSRPKNKSAQMKLDFAPVTEKVSSVASLSRSNNSNSGTPVRKSPYFSSNQQSTPPATNKVKVKAEHDPFISSILSKYDDDDEVQEKDKEIIDLSTQRPVSQVVTKPNKPLVQAIDDDDFKPEPKKNMEEFDDFDVESMLREVGEMGGDESEPKDNVPVIAVDDSSLDGHKSTVSKASSRKKVDTSPSSDNNSESSTTRDSKKRKRGSDERKQRTLGTLNIIGAPEPNLLAEPPKKKRRLSEHIDRVKSKLRYGLDDDEVFMDKEEEEEEMDDEMRDFIVDDNVVLSQYESQALPIDDLGEEEGDEDSARDEAASQSSVKALADKLVKEGETKFLSTTFKMSDAFKIFIQYLVSCTLDPHFASEVERKQDDYFRPAVRKIHDDLFSKKEVIIRSSAWNATFKTNLDRLPVFRSYKMSHPEGECDACKRSMHTASWQIVLEGVSYDANSYWKDGPTNTNPNPHREPEQYTYNLGRFCHKRTELFHRLHHYKFRLNEQITERMNQLPSTLSENEVIDTILDDQLWINRLWKQFQVLRDDALTFGTKGSEDGHD